MSKLKLVNRGASVCRVLSCLVGLGVVVVSGIANATPGAHPPLFSTSDSRASSVVLAYRQALGPLTARMISYNANFSSTGGILSAQFGAHVLQLQEAAAENTLYGAGATGTALWSIPLMSRYDNGVTSVALMVYAGGAPVAAVSGERNFLNVPIGIGLGVPLSPKPWVTFTPWFEAAPGLDLDTTIRQPDLSRFEPDEQDLQDLLNDEDAVIVSEEDVRQVISESVVVDVAFETAMRAGLDVTLRFSDSWSFNVNSYFTSLGSAFSGQSYFYLGAGLLFHWDDVVPSVLPAAVRLERESCDDIEARFRMCPPKQVQSVCPAPEAPATSVNAPPQSLAPNVSKPTATQPPVIVPTAPTSSTPAVVDQKTPPPSNLAPGSTPPAATFPPPPANTTPSQSAPAPAPAAPAVTPAPAGGVTPTPSTSAAAAKPPAAPPAPASPTPAKPAPAPTPVEPTPAAPPATPAKPAPVAPAPAPATPTPAQPASPAPKGQLPNPTSPY